MSDQFKQTGIDNTTIGDNAQISIEQKIISPSTPKPVKQNPHNLPNSGAAQFVGRDKVLTQLHNQLQQAERVVGQGSVGWII